MEWALTLAIVTLFGGLTAFAGWKSGQPRKDRVKPLWISWTGVALVAMIVLVFAARPIKAKDAPTASLLRPLGIGLADWLLAILSVAAALYVPWVFHDL
ncbi:MAG: hypothetical protein ABMA14_24690, partial [Hyphomonadaceae bacterium]